MVGDADTESGYGGRPVLNPWRGRSSGKLKGFGPGTGHLQELGYWSKL